MASIAFHYDGKIAENHQLSLRVLGSTLVHLQSAIDRAYLDNRYDNICKFQRLKKPEYPATDFIVGTPEEGGYILDLIREGGEAIVRRVSRAITNVRAAPWAQGQDEITRLSVQAATRHAQLQGGVYRGRPLAEFAAEPQVEDLAQYGDRSIAKEVDQILAHIRRKQPQEELRNTLELTFKFGGRRDTRFRFDRASAISFHKTVSRRELGEPLLYRGTLRLLDRGRRGVLEQKPKAKLTLEDTQRDIILHIGGLEEYNQLAPYMQGDQVIEMFEIM